MHTVRGSSIFPGVGRRLLHSGMSMKICFFGSTIWGRERGRKPEGHRWRWGKSMGGVSRGFWACCIGAVQEGVQQMGSILRGLFVGGG